MQSPPMDPNTTLQQLAELISPPTSASHHRVDPAMCRLLEVMASTSEALEEPAYFGTTFERVRQGDDDGLPALAMHWDWSMFDGLRIGGFFVFYTDANNVLSFEPREPWVGFVLHVGSLDEDTYSEVGRQSFPVTPDVTLADLSATLIEGRDHQQWRFFESLGAGAFIE